MERFELQELDGSSVPTCEASLELPGDMELDVTIELGRTYLERDDAMHLSGGSIVPLNKSAQQPVDILAGGRLIARGEPVVLDGKIGVRVTELVAGGTTPY